MAIDLAGLWDSGLLLFFLSIVVVVALDVAVMIWASRVVYPKDSPAPRLDAPASKPQPADAARGRDGVTSFAGLREAAP
jgi:P pilus assembly chaperone PapD